MQSMTTETELLILMVKIQLIPTVKMTLKLYQILPIGSTGVNYFHYTLLLYEAMQDESAELCFIFHSAHSVLYFPPGKYSTGNTAPYTLQ